MKNLVAALRGVKPNRVAVYLTGLAGLCTAIAPAVANLDTTSTIGAVSGLAGVVTIAYKFLTGWQAHEAREAVPPIYVLDASVVPDVPQGE